MEPTKPVNDRNITFDDGYSPDPTWVQFVTAGDEARPPAVLHAAENFGDGLRAHLAEYGHRKVLVNMNGDIAQCFYKRGWDFVAAGPRSARSRDAAIRKAASNVAEGFRQTFGPASSPAGVDYSVETARRAFIAGARLAVEQPELGA